MVDSSLRLGVALIHSWMIFSQHELNASNDHSAFNEVLRGDLDRDRKSAADTLLPLQRLQIEHETYWTKTLDYITKVTSSSMEFDDFKRDVYNVSTVLAGLPTVTILVYVFSLVLDLESTSFYLVKLM